ncbi:hypothetical protein KC343_g726 [Hortaea werneckii]|nr:hypothetical protein KC352_g4957 [Hortaea werneckii]KAI7572436.1 hypothetical protein KC317_g758 [Hortaea werneckii]KAI7627528.1 hypothetical protein KC346_g705 [Hortaea werneckii]KAI7637424.1 hypothetical protein KC343_g726 [Hortaea werneckii]KAI7683120.1 hypothetical protein KC319_g628 [Hortaea werneckii]
MDVRIRNALARAIELGEHGLAVAAYYKGRLIDNAAAGHADTAGKIAATTATLWPVFSVTKGVTALAIHIQAERGHLAVSERVSKYWPEFAVNGKENITIEQCLSHRAGELVRRTDPSKRAFDAFVQQEICKPLGLEDFHLGVPDAELGRIAQLSGGNSFTIRDDYNISPSAVFPGSDVHNLKVVQQCVDPGAGAITTAEAVAKIFGLIANGGELDGVRLLSPEAIQGFRRYREGAYDADKVLTIPVWMGAAGFWLGGEPNASDPIVGCHRDIVVSPGAGGSMAWADFRHGLAVAFCHNNMDSVAVSVPERTIAPVVRAIREVVADIAS